MKSVLTIGRSNHCDIIVPHDSVSREHARISVVGGGYVYEDIGKNGSVIGGRVIHGERLAVAPGANILLAGKVPLPWAQIYTMLPLHGVNPYNHETSVASQQGPGISGGYVNPKANESIPIGWGILSFLVPIIGWIMYFKWKAEYPKRATQAATIAWVSFILNLLSFFAAL